MRFALVYRVEPTSPRRQSQQPHLRQSSCQNISSAWNKEINLLRRKFLGLKKLTYLLYKCYGTLTLSICRLTWLVTEKLMENLENPLICCRYVENISVANHEKFCTVDNFWRFDNCQEEQGIILSVIKQSVLRKVHSLFQSELSRVRASASSFNFQYLLFSFMSSSSCLGFLPRLPVPYSLPSTFPSITYFRRQFLRKHCV
jgi:hypothetical protein